MKFPSLMIATLLIGQFGGTGAVAAAATATPTPASAPAPAPAPMPAPTHTLDFSKVFSSKGEPAFLHYRASYVLRGATHRVEVWRAGDTKVRRTADGAVDTFAFKPGRTPEWTLSVLDLNKKLRSDVDRTALIKVGRFMDWFGFAHAVGHPTGAYTLVARSAAPAGVPPPLLPCRWYTLTRGSGQPGDAQQASEICWNTQYRVPSLITSPAGQVQWQLTAVVPGKLPADVFTIHDAGFIHNNANQDIEAD